MNTRKENTKDYFDQIPNEVLEKIIHSCDPRSLRLTSWRFFSIDAALAKKECDRTPLAKGLIEAINLHAQIKNGDLNARVFLTLIKKANGEKLKTFLENFSREVILLYPLYTKNTVSIYNKTNFHFYLSEEIAKKLINNHFNIVQYQKIKLSIDEIDFTMLCKNNGEIVYHKKLTQEQIYTEESQVKPRKVHTI